jgi:hypothetical protein
MFTKKRLGYALWVGLMIGLLSQGSWANNKNFKAAADKSGCESIITTDGIEACKRNSEAKNRACNRASSCELDKQERWAKEYNELVEKWPKMSDYEKERYRRAIRDLRDDLDRGKNAANAGVTIATECVAARNAVQKWFEDTAIPLTERTKNELVPMRKALVEKFNETKTKREDAKKKYEDKPNDDNLRREWEAARDANIEAGRKLDEFDKTYGPDIEYYADKLVRHYQAEKTNHDTPSREAENRLEKCTKTVAVKYESLPSGI